MSEFSAQDKQKLLSLLTEKQKLLSQIEQNTKEQGGLLEKDDIEAFDSSLQQSDSIIEKIKGLHQETDTLMQSYISSKKRDEKIEDLKNAIEQTLKTCAEKNKALSQAAKKRQKDLSIEIEEKRSKREGIGGYAQATPTTSEVFDKKM